MAAVPLPALFARHLPGQSFTSAVAAADAFGRSRTAPLVFSWQYGGDRRGCLEQCMRIALANAQDALRTDRDAHWYWTQRHRWDNARLARQRVAYWLQWSRFYRAVLAELAEQDDRSAGLGALFPEARLEEAA